MKHFSLILPKFLLLASLFWLWPGHTPILFAIDSSVKILFIGDSISAGLGVKSEDAYPALIQNMLKKKGVQGVNITNGSISGSTTAGALSRLKWFLKVKPDILVLALGANDGFRGLSTVEMARNLGKTIALAKEKGIRIILAGMKIPPNYGPEYARAFYEVFVFLADKHKIPLIPFLLKDVAGKASLNQADGIHPNREGHRIIAGTVLPYILEQL
ncbi:MAG: arylesterase [Desulfobacula sp.]|uniref:arylesterase n=1 Tax=Desulfobacula sp. TaxID=2593537 RepID=UPI0025C6DC0B|nr:arylesterase [Desulfobacula sp.]MCD4718957.1 arylesterase [Desulfobacula sp.]